MNFKFFQIQLFHNSTLGTEPPFRANLLLGEPPIRAYCTPWASTQQQATSTAKSSVIVTTIARRPIGSCAITRTSWLIRLSACSAAPTMARHLCGERRPTCAPSYRYGPTVAPWCHSPKGSPKDIQISQNIQNI